MGDRRSDTRRIGLACKMSMLRERLHERRQGGCGPLLLDQEQPRIVFSRRELRGNVRLGQKPSGLAEQHDGLAVSVLIFEKLQRMVALERRLDGGDAGDAVMVVAGECGRATSPACSGFRLSPVVGDFLGLPGGCCPGCPWP